jgi:uncharacterized spore protein YtfJ
MEFIQSIVERLQSTANVKTVYGEPVEVKGRTIIPVAKIAYAFCSCKKNEAEGGGRGMGAVRVKPTGVLEVTEGQPTRFIPINDMEKLVGIFMVGLVLGALMSGKKSRRRD